MPVALQKAIPSSFRDQLGDAVLTAISTRKPRLLVYAQHQATAHSFGAGEIRKRGSVLDLWQGILIVN